MHLTYFATIVAEIKITTEKVTVNVTDETYFSPQKLKMLRCISTPNQWEKAVKALHPDKKNNLQSVVMKITAWKGKPNVWFEVTTSVPNPTAALYFRASRKAKGERFSKLLREYYRQSDQRTVTTHIIRRFNHTQVPRVSRYYWDEMTKGMEQFLSR